MKTLRTYIEDAFILILNIGIIAFMLAIWPCVWLVRKLFPDFEFGVIYPWDE